MSGLNCVDFAEMYPLSIQYTFLLRVICSFTLKKEKRLTLKKKNTSSMYPRYFRIVFTL